MTGPSGAIVAVVDDDPGVLDAMSNLLEAAGHTVARFDSAEAFLDSFVPGAFDCLISDIGLPGMDGLELQTELSLRATGLPVILITGRDDYGASGPAEVGNPRLFRKPFVAEELLAALAEAIASRSST